MNGKKLKIELKVTEDGLKLLSDINLTDFGICNGDVCLLTIDDETGEAKFQKICDALIDEIEKQDEKVMNIIFEESSALPAQIQSSTIPKSGVTLISLLAAINSLKLSIFEICKSRDIYSLNVLYRSFLEHFIKINYFFYRLLTDKTDIVGEDYYKFYSQNEIAMYGKSLEQLRLIVDLEYRGKDIAEILYEIDPELKKYSSKELKGKILQYNYKNMIKFIFDKQNSTIKDVDFSIILSIIPEYAELSSFVHGGPYAIDSTAKSWNNNEIEMKCCQFARSTFSIYIISNLLLIVLYTRFLDKNYSLFYNKINDVWKEASEKIEEYFEPFK
ncbi:MAG: DUF5677 domain-containing protein [Ignavibacteria bacterium]|nr:DUF5677 domain-containing protein [Ignavibacteria bacterium]